MMINMETVKNLALYIHIPFCVRKCLYCDFLSFTGNVNTYDNYVNQLLHEIDEWSKKEFLKEYLVKTIFIGGGTPSAIPQEYIAKILCKLQETFIIDKNAEITIECNPGTVTEDKLWTYYVNGINRLSFGLQSTDNIELSRLGRIHTFEQFEENFYLARKVGFQNINIDLMSAIPGQTYESLRRSLETVTALNPEHVSVYGLIIEEGTPFYEMYQNDMSSFPNEDMDRDMYRLTNKLLKEAGYHHYEISNYAKPGLECRHNLTYWQRGEYLGLGLGAASLLQNKRFTNATNIDAYNRYNIDLDAIPELTDQECIEETMFLGLRTDTGVNLTLFEKNFGKSVDSFFPGVEERMIKEGLIKKIDESIVLTERGIDISNYVMGQFIF